MWDALASSPPPAAEPGADSAAAAEEGYLFVGTFDGHGPHGHYISRHVRERLPAMLHTMLAPGFDALAAGLGAPRDAERACTTYALGEGGALRVTEPGKLAGRAAALQAPLLRAFVDLDDDVCAARSSTLQAAAASSAESGTTAAVALLWGAEAVVAMCGDSCAYLVTAAVGGASTPAIRRLNPVPHKPMGAEAARIRNWGGRIEAHPDEPHVMRIWPKTVKDASMNYGVALSRAIGDANWKTSGLARPRRRRSARGACRCGGACPEARAPRPTAGGHARPLPSGAAAR